MALSGTSVHDKGTVEAAALDAQLAAKSARVSIRELTQLEEFRVVCNLFDTIWRPSLDNPPVTPELLRVLSKAGNYVVGAFDDDQPSEMIGACIGLFGPPADRKLYSHIAGVTPRARGRSVGRALKLHQRAWTLVRGGHAIFWTFDPLVRRNAHFNLSKLASVPVEYLPNFYGFMRDGINGDDDSDRLLVRWELDSPTVCSASAGTPVCVDAAMERAAGAAVALKASDRNLPVLGAEDARMLLVGVPADIEALRTSDPASARQWRLAVRDVLGRLMGDGAQVIGFDRTGWYALSTVAGGEDYKEEATT